MSDTEARTNLAPEWSQTTVGAIVPDEKPICYGVLKPGSYDRQGVPLIRICDIEGDVVATSGLFKITPQLDAAFARSRVSGGEVLLSIQGTIGRVAVVPRAFGAANISRTIARIAVRDGILPNFVRHYLLSPGGQTALFDSILGTTRASLNIGVLRRLGIVLPKEDEQAAIADILDTVDEAIRQTSAVIEKLKKIKAGLLHDLLTRGIDEAGQLRDPIRQPEQFQNTPLGKVPKEWKVKPLGSLCDLLNGLAFKPSDWTTTGRPIIRIQNLNGGLDFNYYKLPVPEKYVIPPGTLLFSWSGNRGTSFGPFIWPGPTGLLNQHIFRVYPAENVRMRWFYYALDDVRQRVERAAHGAIGLVHVRRSDLVKYLVGRPEPDEQERIEVAMQHHDARARSEEDTLRKLTLMKQGLMHDLLTGRVRVPMKTNGKAAKP